MTDSIRRLAPERAFPPYAYIPGRFPHPTRDPRGHSYGHAPARADPADPAEWRRSRPYLFALDLYNHGYYWEAHEVWESLWHASGRQGATASFLKALIFLAAAEVKGLENMLRGETLLRARAKQLFLKVHRDLGGPETYLGLAFSDLLSERPRQLLPR